MFYKYLVFMLLSFAFPKSTVIAEGSDDEISAGKQEKKSTNVEKKKSKGSRVTKNGLPVPNIEPAPAPKVIPEFNPDSSSHSVSPATSQEGGFFSFFNIFSWSNSTKFEKEFLSSAIIEIDSLEKFKKLIDFIKSGKMKRASDFSIRFSNTLNGSLEYEIRNFFLYMPIDVLFRFHSMILPKGLSRIEIEKILTTTPRYEDYNEDKNEFRYNFDARHNAFREIRIVRGDEIYLASLQDYENFVASLESGNTLYEHMTAIHIGFFDVEPYLSSLLVQIINNRLPNIESIDLFYPLVNHPNNIPTWNTIEFLNYQMFDYKPTKPLDSRHFLRIFVNKKKKNIDKKL